MLVKLQIFLKFEAIEVYRTFPSRMDCREISFPAPGEEIIAKLLRLQVQSTLSNSNSFFGGVLRMFELQEVRITDIRITDIRIMNVFLGDFQGT